MSKLKLHHGAALVAGHPITRVIELDIAAIAVAQEKHRPITNTIVTAAIVASATLKVAILRGRHHGRVASATLAAPGAIAGRGTLELAGTGCPIHDRVHPLALLRAPVTMNGVKEQPSTTSTGHNGKPNTVTANGEEAGAVPAAPAARQIALLKTHLTAGTTAAVKNASTTTPGSVSPRTPRTN